MGLIDRLSDGIGKLGQVAGQALDESRIQMELMRARRRKDNGARDLGYLVYRVAQGAVASPGEQEALVRRIADAEQTIDRLESEVRQVRHRPDAAVAPDTPTPAGDPAAPPDGTAAGQGEPVAPEPPDDGAAATTES